MYAVDVDDSNIVTVNSGRHQVQYSVDRSLINPLEAFYAALAGCAAVFAKKACAELGVSAQGIHLSCRPYAGTGGPMTLARYRTEVSFPEHFPENNKAQVLDAIGHCAVKKIVETGVNVTFSVTEAALSPVPA